MVLLFKCMWMVRNGVIFVLAIEIFLGFREQEVVTATALNAKKAIEF